MGLRQVVDFSMFIFFFLWVLGYQLPRYLHAGPDNRILLLEILCCVAFLSIKNFNHFIQVQIACDNFINVCWYIEVCNSLLFLCHRKDWLFRMHGSYLWVDSCVFFVIYQREHSGLLGRDFISESNDLSLSEKILMSLKNLFFDIVLDYQIIANIPFYQV